MAKLTKPARDRISATKFAFPKQRKEPLENASHVRNAVARFNQVKGVAEAERRAAWKWIQSAAKRYGVELEESDYSEHATMHARHASGSGTVRQRTCSRRRVATCGGSFSFVGGYG
jgi:hypothetical protein